MTPTAIFRLPLKERLNCSVFPPTTPLPSWPVLHSDIPVDVTRPARRASAEIRGHLDHILSLILDQAYPRLDCFKTSACPDCCFESCLGKPLLLWALTQLNGGTRKSSQERILNASVLGG